MESEETLNKLPPGWSVWGNFGDGLWRAGPGVQFNLIVPAETQELAILRAAEVAKKRSSHEALDDDRR
jgi:hypothetical protein